MSSETFGRNRTVAVVGASLAGLRAVEAARRCGYDGRLVLVGAEEHLPYDRLPLSKAFLTDHEMSTTQFRDESHFAELAVDLELGVPAGGLDIRSKHIALTNGRRVAFDGMLLATGCTPRVLPNAACLEGVHVLRTIDDALRLRSEIVAGSDIVVIGSGFIGSEIASSARKLGKKVTVVEAMSTPLVRAVGEQMGDACALLHLDQGTDLRCGTAVAKIEGGTRVEGVRLTGGDFVPADVVVMAVGVAPTTDWLSDSGLTLGNGVGCDRTLRAGPSVYAAGDIARWPNELFDRTMRVEHWTVAAEQGAHAMLNLLGVKDEPYETVPYFWSDWYDDRIQFVGMPGDGRAQVHVGSVEERRFVALYRERGRLVGALAVNEPTLIMKYRRLIARGTSWEDVPDHRKQSA